MSNFSWYLAPSTTLFHLHVWGWGSAMQPWRVWHCLSRQTAIFKSTFFFWLSSLTDSAFYPSWKLYNTATVISDANEWCQDGKNGRKGLIVHGDTRAQNIRKCQCSTIIITHTKQDGGASSEHHMTASSLFAFLNQLSVFIFHVGFCLGINSELKHLFIVDVFASFHCPTFEYSLCTQACPNPHVLSMKNTRNTARLFFFNYIMLTWARYQPLSRFLYCKRQEAFVPRQIEWLVCNCIH